MKSFFHSSISFFVPVLLGIMGTFLLFSDANAQCYVSSSETINFTSFGGNFDQEYNTQFFLTTGDNVVVKISNTNSFSASPIGQYKIYAINYQVGSNEDLPQVGESIFSMSGDCFDISNAFEILVCPEPDDCDVCQGQDIAVNVLSENDDPDYTNLYFLTNASGSILEIQNTPDFGIYTPGVYIVYGINYLTSEGINGLFVGGNVSNVSGICFDISALPQVVCPLPEAELTAAPNCQDNETDNDPNDDYIEFEIVANVSSATYQIEVNGFNSPQIASGTPYLVTGNGTNGNPLLSADGQTTYTVNIVDGQGCASSLQVGPVVACSFVSNCPDPIPYCCGADYLLTRTLIGDTRPDNYSWYKKEGQTLIPISTTEILDGNGNTVYEATVNESGTYVLQDPNGDCVGDGCCPEILEPETESPEWALDPQDITYECSSAEDYNALYQAWLDQVILNPELYIDDNCEGQGNDITIIYDETENSLCADNATPFERIVIFTPIDGCGSRGESRLATFAVEDSRGPFFDNSISYNLQIDCGDVNLDQQIENFIQSIESSVSDDCSSVVVSNNYDPNLNYPIVCSSTESSFVIDFTAKDLCGNVSVASATVSVVDQSPPSVFMPGMNASSSQCGVPAVFVFNSWLRNNANAIYTDECSSRVHWSNDFNGVFPFDCGQSGSIDVTFTASDDCENSTSFTRSFTIIDNNGPQWVSNPQNLVLDCSDGTNNDLIIQNWLNNNGNGLAYDECSRFNINYSFDVIDLNETDCEGGVNNSSVEFTATDDCGNSTTTTAFISYFDQTPPVINCPADLELDCGGLTLSELNQLISEYVEIELYSYDACDSDLLISVEPLDALPELCTGGESSAVVQVSAADNCGNVASCQFTVEFIDREAPEIVNCPSDLVLDCEEIHNYDFDTWVNTLVATDNCTAFGDLVVESNFDKGLLDVPCSTRDWNEHMLEIKFEVTDACGNTSTCSTIITVQDETAPELDCPGDLTLSCGSPYEDLTLERWLNSATATDNCDNNVRITNDFRPDLLSSSLTCDYNLTEPIALTTMGGNTSQEYTTEYVLADNAGIILQVSNTPNFSNPGSGVYTAYAYNYENGSNFSGLQIGINVSEVSGECFDRSSYTFTVCDPGTGICDDDGNNVPILVRFTAVDDCGNSTECSANIFLIDETAPEINCPADLVLDCGNLSNVDQVVNWLRTIRAEDGCDETIDLTHSLMGQDINEILEANNPCIDGSDGLIEVEFTAEDDCSNTSRCIGYIRIEDTTSPEISSCPERLEIACDPGLDYDEFVRNYVAQNLSFSDECQELNFTDHVDVDIQGDLSAVCPDDDTPAFVTVEIRVSDECGNFSTCDFEVVVVDREAPEIVNCPTDLNLECEEIHSYDFDAWLSTLVALDNCTASGDLVVESNFDKGLLDVPCSTRDWNEHMLEIKFEVRDACGNTSTCSAIITVEDETAPELDCPEDLTLSCGSPYEDLTIERWLNSATAADNCDNNVRITNDFRPELLSSSLTCDYNLTEPIALTTMGGNTSQEYTTQYVLADNAGVILQVSNTPNFSNPGSGVYTAYAYNYENGSNFSGLQIGINVSQVTGDCFDRSSYTFTVCESGSSICDEDGNNVPILVRFTAVDNCGNSTVCTANIFLVDETAPEIYCPADLVLECGNESNVDQVINWLRTVRAEDGCDERVDISHSLMGQNIAEVLEAKNPCLDGNDGVIEIEFTAEDDCSNTNSCIGYIRIEDTTPPEITSCPERLEIACDPNLDYEELVRDYVAQNLSFSDVCTELNFADHVDIDIQGELDAICPDDDTPAFVTIEVLVSDDCGNFSTCDFEVVVVDREAPVIVACPVDITLECADVHDYDFEGWITSFEAIDNCSEEGNGLTLSNNFDEGLLDEPCSVQNWDDHVLTVTFTATDACGNFATCEASITIIDETSPIVDCPEALTLECGAKNIDGLIATWLNSASATDDCDREVSINNNYDASLLTKPCEGSGDRFVLEVTFTASDDCGNTETCVSEIIIIDDTDPILLCPDGSLVLECGHPENVKNLRGWLESARAEDDCDSAVEILTSLDNEDLEELIALNSPCENGEAPGRIEVVFTAIDDCGNETTCRSEVLIYDTDEPEIACVESLFLNCSDIDEQLIEDWLNSVTATDDCDEDLAVTNSFDLEDLESPCRGIGQNFELEVTFTATDDCGNTARCISRIVISDDTPPSIDCPDELDLTCNMDSETMDMIVRRWIGSASATDNCDEDVQIMTSYTLGMLDAPCLGNGEDGRYEVVFTAMDDCGNAAKCVSYINITDEEAPEIQCPGDLVLECGKQNIDIAIADWLLSATATDDCDTDVAISNDFEASELRAYCIGDQPFGLTVTFTATDNCGNSSSCEATVTLIDESAPEIVCPPSPLILECGDEHNVEILAGYIDDVRAYDACDADVEISSNLDDLDLSVVINDNSPCIDGEGPGSFVVEFTATDDCGNESTCEVTVKIRDNTPPELTCPTTLVLECGRFNMNDIEDWLESASAYDACDDEVEVNYSWDELNLEPCEGDDLPAITDVTFTAIDDCGNSTTCVARIRVEDNMTPEIACPADELILDCALNMEMMHIEVLDWIAQARAYDLCDDEVAITTNYTLGVLDEPCALGDEGFAFEVIFNATDDCGNTAQCTQVIRVIDNEAPDIVCPDDLTIDCSNANAQVTIADWLNRATATDDCDSDVSITNDFDAEDLEAACENGSESFSLTVTFTATDNCGNTSSCEATITIEDDEAPTISCPSGGDLILECGDDLNVDRLEGWLNSATATDVCDPDVEIVSSLDGQDLSAVLNANNPCVDGQTAGEILVVFTATDACGNVSTCEASVIIRDTEAPELICPKTLVLECGAYDLSEINTWLATAQATDNCTENIVVTNNFDPSQLMDPCLGDDIPSELEVSFFATDDCGNAASCNAIIRIEDNEAPEINCPADPLELSCYTSEADQDAAVRAWIATATATDLCDDDVEVTTNYTRGVLDEPCSTNEESFTFEVVFTAIDDCGNTAQCTQVITVIDNEAPDIVCPDDLTIDCGVSYEGLTIEDWLNSVVATDNCDNDVEVINNFGPELLTGGSSCDFNLDEDIELTAMGGNNSPDYKTEYILTDSSGVIIQLSATPNFTNPGAGIYTAYAYNYLNGSNFSGLQLGMNVSEANGECFDKNEYVFTVCEPTGFCSNDGNDVPIVVTFTAVDNCGNTSECTANLYLIDETAPDISCPPGGDLILECGDDLNVDRLEGWLSSATATDICDPDVDIVSSLDGQDLSAVLSANHPCVDGQTSGEILVVFTATDACGNESTCEARVIIRDTEAPELICPKTLVLECGAYDLSEISTWLATAQVTDNCTENVTVTNNFDPSQLIDPCLGDDIPSELEVSFFAADDCGNAARCNAIIRIEDNEAPEITCPKLELVIGCGLTDQEIAVAVFDWVQQATATDNCDPDVEITTDYRNGGLAGPCQGLGPNGWYEVTFTATDNCGNTSSCSQYIRVEDNEAPEFTQVPADKTVDCGDEILYGTPQFTDDCDNNLLLTFTDTVGNKGCLGESYIRVWTVTDNCGNTATASQEIVVEDNEAPAFTFVADDITIGCDEPLVFSTPIYSDNCSEYLVLDYVDAINNAVCVGEEITRTWILTDGCGNEATATQKITREYEAPNFVDQAPSDVTVECDNVPVAVALRGTVFCNQQVEIQADEQIIPGTCDGEYTLTRRWILSDNCGNELVQEQVISVIDTEAPVITGVPANTTIDALPLPPLPNVNATDNCSGVELDFDEIMTSNDCGLIAVRSWIATDDCGNTSTAEQIIIVSPDAFDVTLDLTSGNDCFGDLEGSVSATVTGGTAPYTYSWSNGETGASATNLPSGEVTVMVTDANGCMGTASIDVPGPEEPLEIEISVDSELDCNSSGEVSATVSGGTAPFTIQWSNGDTGTSTSVNGTFVAVTVTDANGCMATDEEEVEESCFDLALIKESNETMVEPGDFINYTITIYNQGTSPAYNIHINDDLPDGVILADNQWRSVGGNVITLMDPIAFIPAGGSLPVTLRVMVDNNFTGMMLLNRAEIVDADDDTNPANGKPQDDDSVYDEDFDNDVVGGDNTINNENGDEDDHDFDKINVSTDCVGDYREEEITINCGEDAFLCLDIELEDIEDFDIEIDGEEYDDIYYVCDDDRVVQYDYCVLSDHGNDGPYELLSWIVDGVEYSTTFGDIYDLVAYMNSVDPNGNWVLREAEQLIEGGDDTKQYHAMIFRQLRLLGQPLAEMGASISYHPVGTSINLGGESGMRIVTISEPGSDCPDTIKVTIDEILPTIENIEVENTCVGESDGSISINMMGSENNYIWTWTPNVSNGPTADNLAAGVYTVVITAKGDSTCRITEQIEVEEIDPTPLMVKVIEDASCVGNDGSVVITPGNAGTYIWSDGQTTISGERNDLAAGDYQLRLINDEGCESEIEFTIGLDNTLELNLESIEQADCDEGGFIELSVSGGSGSYSFEWSDDTGITDAERTDLDPGIYGVTVTDNAEEACLITDSFEILDECFCIGERVDTLIEAECNEDVAYCTDIDEFDVNSWTITIDGQEYTGPFDLCGEERFLRYQYDKLLGDGYFGPFEVIDWTVNGVSYNGTFDNIDEIVAFMNVNDPQGNWTLNRNTKRILGGDQTSDYGSLIIRQLRFQVTNRVDTFAIAEGQEATKIAIPVSDGMTTILLQGPDADCADTVVTTVVRTGELNAFVLYTLPASCYQANGVASLFPPDLDYQWNDGGTGSFRADLIQGVYSVTATDGNCSVELNVVITRNIGSGCDDCEDYIVETYITEEIEDCDEYAQICVEVNPHTFNGTQFRLDNQLIDLDDPCRTDTVQFAYNHTLIPDNGSIGPYSLDSWMINGQTYSGSFDNLTELVNLMNALDADGDWSLTQTGEITGAMEGDMPGSLTITQSMTGMQVHINPEVLLGPVAYIVEVPVGQHELFSYNALTGCRDTAWIEVLCDEALNANDDQVTMRTEQRSLNIDVLANDEFMHYDIVRITQQPTNGWARVSSAGQIVYHSDLDRCEQANKDELEYDLISGERTDQATVTIDYACSNLSIPQVISVDGNGLNNRFDIEGMTPDKKVEVTIFNTLGQVVYHEADYQSVPAWDGSIQNYRNGYSSATYFYMVRQGGEAPITGYIQVLR